MARQLSVMLVQMDVASGDVEANLARAGGLVVESPADLIVLPEMFTTGCAFDRLRDLAEPLNGKTVSFLAGLAARRRAYVAASFAERGKDGVYNTFVLLDRGGGLRMTYRKVHLVPMMDEPRYVRPGDRPASCRTEFGRWGAMICYDIRFPELARRLTLDGAELLIVPAEFPDPRRSHWRTLLLARAVENQVFVVAANRVGEDGGYTFFGSSAVVDPWGEVLAEGGREEAVLTCRIDLDAVEDVRQRVPALQGRRPEAYG
jgi:predicted amidohydrolase